MELTVEQALQKGIEAHKAGQIQDADRFYTAILKVQPKHPDANHNLGVLAVSIGKIQEALPLLKTALEANPSIAQFWISYIEALIKLDQLADAKAMLDQAKSKGAKGEGFDKLAQQLQQVSTGMLDSNRSSAAELQPEQSNILDSLKLDQALKLANKKVDDGAIAEAKRIYQDVLTKFPQNKRAKDGLKKLDRIALQNSSKVEDPPQDQLQSLVNLYSQGHLQQALQQAEALLQKFPQSALVWNIKGAALKGLEQLDLSIDAFKQALSIKPDYADAYNNMGVIFKSQGKMEEALEAYNTALSIEPEYPDAHYNLGLALQKQGQLNKAVEAYQKALTSKPNYADAYREMGNALKRQGKSVEAMEAYNKALSVERNNADTHNNMGLAFQDQHKFGEAIACYQKALSLRPDYPEAYNNLGSALKGVIFNQHNPELQKSITSLLDGATYVRPSEIAHSAISLLKLEPKLIRNLPTPSMAQDKPKLLDTIADLSELPLLLKLMSVCPLPDLEIENLLKMLRSSMLLSISEIAGSDEVLKFLTALALQCFTNEYIYDNTVGEDKALADLEIEVEQTIRNGDQPSPQSVLCLATYKPLHEYEWVNSLLVTNTLEHVFTRQVTEPNLETQLKTNIPILSDISDNVSAKVRDQYELSPYPRWVNSGLNLKPVPISKLVDEIELKIFNHEIKNIKSPDILIAGCGTGQHSIGTAARFKDSKVLAVDLSLSSLSYAKRKTDELMIKNIEYMQADILDLCKLGRQFDIVESAGVLHHMDDPLAGWRVLANCLKQGGLMKIGLYSELARQQIVKTREEIIKAGIGSSDEEMKSFRAMVMASEQEEHRQMLNFSDFYSMSELKDLLFHVQEHRFTIPQIKDCMADLGLKFCGFEAPSIVSHFKLSLTNAKALYNLNKWQEFELNNPNAFAGMYQFWCQKLQDAS